MLDAETKARIDSARDILVGKVPDPKSQVEQITIALIYKFMDDMDRQSEELGGVALIYQHRSARRKMQTYRVETMVSSNRTLTIKGLPFQAGEKVEVIVRRRERELERRGRYPLRGKPIRYTDPFKSVAESDWEALQ